MNKPKSFMLNNFDEEELKHIIYYIRNAYGCNSIIYGSVGFCAKLADNLLPDIRINDTEADDIFYKNLDENDAKDIGLLGKMVGTPIICVPELNEINAIIIPDWANLWGKYFEKENENE